MAQGALRPQRSDLPRVVEPARQTEHGIELEQGERRGGIVEIHLPGLELCFQLLGQGIGVHFEADRERGLRAHARPDAAVFRARDRLVELQGVAEEGFRAVGIEAEDLPALFDHALRVLADLAVNFRKSLSSVFRPTLCLFVVGESERDKQTKPDQNRDGRGPNRFPVHAEILRYQRVDLGARPGPNKLAHEREAARSVRIYASPEISNTHSSPRNIPSARNVNGEIDATCIPLSTRKMIRLARETAHRTLM